MFMVMAIGTLMDPKEQAYSLEAEKFHQLARAALFQSPLFDEPTLTAVQALVCNTPLHILWHSPSMLVFDDILPFPG